MALSFVRLKMKYFCSMNIFSGTLLDWYAENKRDLPWRNTTDPYLIWISEIILQQTRVAQGYEYFLRFIKRFPDVVSLAAASEDEVMKYWQGLGYYSRARNLHAAAKSMKGTFPKTYAEVRALKGVGDYTAAAFWIASASRTLSSEWIIATKGTTIFTLLVCKWPIRCHSMSLGSSSYF